MRRCAFALAAVPFLAAPAGAEAACTAPGGPGAVDPCVVGYWVGDNSAAELVRNNIQRLTPPGMSRTTFPAMPAALGMIVTADGTYISMGFTEGHAFLDESEHDTVLSSMQLTAAPESGYLTARGGQMTFCPSQDGLAWLEMSTASTLGGSREVTIPITPGAGQGFRPAMTYQCSPSFLLVRVQLPAPIGPVEYRLGEVGAEAFGEYLSAAVLERLGSTMPGAGAGAEAGAPDPSGPEVGAEAPSGGDGLPLDGIEPVVPVEVAIPGPDGIVPVAPVEVPIPTPRPEE